MKKKSLFIVFCILSLYIKINAQSGAVVSVGLTTGYTDNPIVNHTNGFQSGWHASLSARFADGNWYLRPGLELHKVLLEASNLIEPFADRPSVYLLKIPTQIGYKVLNTKFFDIHLQAGLQTTYTLKIQENAYGYNHDKIRDFQFGALFGAAVDLGPLVLSMSYERAFTEMFTDTGFKADYFIYGIGFYF
ncbi:MAG TPA: outer membrane beta-barrel protein [Saprospiraceae bacterium]|nr:outer membrane beta-barrel protein [Saprospiraceae bacterium]